MTWSDKFTTFISLVSHPCTRGYKICKNHTFNYALKETHCQLGCAKNKESCKSKLPSVVSDYTCKGFQMISTFLLCDVIFTSEIDLEESGQKNSRLRDYFAVFFIFLKKSNKNDRDKQVFVSINIKHNNSIIFYKTFTILDFLRALF